MSLEFFHRIIQEVKEVWLKNETIAKHFSLQQLVK